MSTSILSGAEMNVTELPVWADCPFRSIVPDRYEIRKSSGVVVLIGRSGEDIFHVALSDEGQTINDKTVLAMVRNLGGFIFNHEHPGEHMRLIKARVVAASEQKDLSDKDKALLAYLDRLSAAA